MSQNGKCHSLVTQDDPTLPLCFINWLRRWVVTDEVVNLLGTKAGKIKQAITAFAKKKKKKRKKKTRYVSHPWFYVIHTVFTVIRSAVNNIKFSVSVAGGITAPI
ncbi:hypothetical protein A9K55_004505 [Cordyceps militaris]|uniref:Uncharacterized protein n=1 Tax=Cordyceps militaris TaxID=73501 RepID=A0A2H4SM37_CORMI|nr:hypothetical protein A9K55_004505 [Cordyceps militaris]